MIKLIDITGKAISGEWGDDDKDGMGIAVLRTTNFTNEGIIDYDSVVTCSIKKKDLGEKYLRNGDIIIEKSGGSDKQPVGRVVFFEGQENKYLFNNFTGVLRVKDREKWNPKYVFYSLFDNYSKGGTREYENKTTGLHNLKTERYVSDFVVLERTYAEQCRIVDIIDCIVEAERKRKQQLEKLDELVKARFVEMFGDPVQNPCGWKTDSLKSVTSKIGSGATPKGGKESYQTEGITLIRSMNVHDGRFEYKELAHITDEQAKQLDNVTVEENDVFINITGASVARSCIVPKQVLPARVNQHVAIIRCVSTVLNPVFANQMFLNRSFKGRLLDMGESGGATRQAITKQQLETLEVILPSLDLQEKFADFVNQTAKSKVDIQKSLEQLETLKKALMQKYFG